MNNLGADLVGVLVAQKLMEEQFRMPDSPEVETSQAGNVEHSRPKSLPRLVFLRLPELFRLIKIING
jgi:hypothetical protein